MSRRLVSIIVSAAASIAMASVANAQFNPKQLPPPISQTVPISALGYAPFSEGEIRAPELGYKRQTAKFLSSNSAYSQADERSLETEAKRLIDAGRGQAAIDYLKANLHRSPHGLAELTLANFYISKGGGGLTVAQDQTYYWLSRAAEKAPYYWYFVGNGYYNGYWGAEKNPAKAAHIWSKSITLGCAECAEAMGDFYTGQRKGVIVSKADAFKYTVFAIEMGEEFGMLQRMDKILRHVSLTEKGDMAPAAKLKKNAIAYAGSEKFNYGGLTKALFETYRTGLVSEDAFGINAHIDAGRYDTAFNQLANLSGGSGRYMAALYNKLFLTTDRLAPNYFEPAHMRWAKVNALVGGDMSHAMAAGEIYLTGYSVKHTYGKDTKTTYDSESTALKLFDAARISGNYDAELAAKIAPDLAEAQANTLRKNFSKCWDMWEYTNRSQTTLANGKKIRNMAFMEKCESEFSAAYNASQDNRTYLQSFLDEYKGWAGALNKDRAKIQKRLDAEAWAKHNRKYGGTYSSGSSAPTPKTSAPLSTISSAEAYSNAARQTCSWSNNTSHLCK